MFVDHIPKCIANLSFGCTQRPNIRFIHMQPLLSFHTFLSCSFAATALRANTRFLHHSLFTFVVKVLLFVQTQNAFWSSLTENRYDSNVRRSVHAKSTLASFSYVSFSLIVFFRFRIQSSFTFIQISLQLAGLSNCQYAFVASTIIIIQPVYFTRCLNMISIELDLFK